jgi:hypothetical protein
VGVYRRFLNLRENRLYLQQSFAIRKAQHAKATPGEPLCARLVPRALIFVLPAIQFDHHAFDATKIDDVWADRMLATKLHA